MRVHLVVRIAGQLWRARISGVEALTFERCAALRKTMPNHLRPADQSLSILLVHAPQMPPIGLSLPSSFGNSWRAECFNVDKC